MLTKHSLPMMWVECPLCAFFVLTFWCDCGVVMYCIFRRAKSFSPQSSPKTRTNHFSAHLTTTKPFAPPSACNALHRHPTHSHQLGMGVDIGRPPLEHPGQWGARLWQWRPQLRPYCSHKLEYIELVLLSSRAWQWSWSALRQALWFWSPLRGWESARPCDIVCLCICTVLAIQMTR